MKQVIGIFGGDSQVGTTMIAQSLAELLSKRDEKVLLILGSGKYGDQTWNVGTTKSLDDLKAGIRSGNVEREELLQALEKRKDLWILPGVRNPLMAKYYPENTYQVLLQGIVDDFDYVIIDGGSDCHLGLTISALNDSDTRIYITTQQAKVISRFVFLQKQVLVPLQFQGTLVVNKYVKDPALYLKADILRMCETKGAILIPYVEYGWQAEMEGASLLSYRGFYRGIEELAAAIIPQWKKESRWKRNSV